MISSNSNSTKESTDTDSELLKRANKDGRLLVDRLEKDFGAKVVRGDSYVEVPGYGLLVEKVYINSEAFNKRSGSRDIRGLRVDQVEVRRTESRRLEWVKIEPALKNILLTDIAAERKASEEQEQQRREAQEKHQQLVRDATKREETQNELVMPKIFISYAHKDEAFKDELVVRLDSIQRRGIIDAWQDSLIEAGDEWYKSIQNAMNDCDIALLLVSQYFLASRFIRKKEIPRLLQRRKDEGLRVVPIIIRPCTWNREPVLKDLQALPKYGKAVITYPEETGERDQVWKDIAEVIERQAKALRSDV